MTRALSAHAVAFDVATVVATDQVSVRVMVVRLWAAKLVLRVVDSAVRVAQVSLRDAATPW